MPPAQTRLRVAPWTRPRHSRRPGSGPVTAATPARPPAARYHMLLLDRRGYGDSPPRATPATFDVRAFDTQAEEIADLLGEGAHLVGHSYGGLLSLLAAACRPDAVRSLTVIEP